MQSRTFASSPAAIRRFTSSFNCPGSSRSFHRAARIFGARVAKPKVCSVYFGTQCMHPFAVRSLNENSPRFSDSCYLEVDARKAIAKLPPDRIEGRSLRVEKGGEVQIHRDWVQ
jgi:hypothetical protein